MIDRLNAALSGRYRVERELGQGGMATVYLVHDLKHDRQVALKVLRPELAAVVGAERFLAEIKTTANLQHPNILPLFDSGVAGGSLFYVMPLIEGESLKEKIQREGELHVDEAVRLACEVAEGLQAAHEAGIIHRDVKPANILLSRGRPLIADFGIALATSQVGGGRLTETGLSLGTPYYMSPEQAIGDRVPTAASDVYALGCVLYEMLTGKPPFTGTSAQVVLGKILLGSPTRPTELRGTIPANVEGAILKALEKLPADRFDTADDFARALRESSFRYGTEAAEAGAGAGKWKAVAGAVGAMAVVLAGVLTWIFLHPPPPPAVARSILGFAPGQEPLDLPFPTLALAPDGSFIVYVGPGVGREEGSSQLWVKQRAELRGVPLAGTASAQSPTVSPDGEWVAYHVPVPGGPWRQLRKSPLSGGAAITLADSVGILPSSPAWLENETIVYLDLRNNLRTVPDAGGVSDVLYPSPPDRLLILPKALPGSRAILFGVCDMRCLEGQEVWALDLESGEAQSLVAGALAAEYAKTGHLVFVRSDGTVFAAAFDLRSLEMTGVAVPVLQGVKVDGVPDFALSPDGTVLMMTGVPTSGLAEFMLVTRDGAATPVDSGWTFDPAAGGGNRGWSLSPDGTRLAVRIAREVEYGTDIWIKELPGGPLSRLTHAGFNNRSPRWAPNSDSVTFLSNYDVWTTHADGVGEPSLLYDYDRDLADGFWTPDGARLVLRTSGAYGAGDRDILVVRPGVDSAATPLMAEAYDEMTPEISPDARWIAYASRETGREEIYVRPFPDVRRGKWQVSTDGGMAPLWAHNGRELFFMDLQRNVVAASVETEPRFRVVEHTVLFRLGTEYYWDVGWGEGAWDITADDERFFLARSVRNNEAVQTRIVLVQNWFEELGETMGGGRRRRR